VLVVDAVLVDAMQDWSKLAGSVLCRSCYVQYSKTGTLDRIKQGPLAKSAKRCCYDGCKSPTESRQFLRIEGASQAGGQVAPLSHTRVVFGEGCRVWCRNFGGKRRLMTPWKCNAGLDGAGRVRAVQEVLRPVL
jgi:hypothetical protein